MPFGSISGLVSAPVLCSASVRPITALYSPLFPDKSIEFQMFGWPQWGTTLRDTEKRAAGGRHVDGLIYLADTSPDSLLVIEPQRIPFGVSSASSDWVGMSGAAIICDGLIVAVQSAHHNHNPLRPQALEAAPIAAIHQDLHWQALLKKRGLGTNLAIAKVKLAKTGNSLNTLRSRFNPNTRFPFSPSHLLTPASLAFGVILSTIVPSIPVSVSPSAPHTQPHCASRGRIKVK